MIDLLFFWLFFVWPPRHKPFITRKTLCAIDHNYHLYRPLLSNESGGTHHYQRHNQRTKRWDIGSLKEAKDYSYIPMQKYLDCVQMILAVCKIIWKCPCTIQGELHQQLQRWLLCLQVNWLLHTQVVSNLCKVKIPLVAKTMTFFIKSSWQKRGRLFTITLLYLPITSDFFHFQKFSLFLSTALVF